MTELHQPLATYYHSERCSRIDRVYTSLAASDLLPFDINTKLVHLKGELSDHKPIQFTIEAKREKGKSTLPLWVWNHPWFEVAFKAAREFYKVDQEGYSSYSRLLRIGKALKATGRALAGAGEECPPVTCRDMLNVVLVES